jgi:hypothetical protein
MTQFNPAYPKTFPGNIETYSQWHSETANEEPSQNNLQKISYEQIDTLASQLIHLQYRLSQTTAIEEKISLQAQIDKTKNELDVLFAPIDSNKA